ncbi:MULTISPECIES: nicotinamide riboside transporter PnuC [Duncaniella]|uniref:Nicotinamide riboside transporter PnuC n=3 Tax=Duncaniella TaxID=2518495 RepID=A0A4P7W5V6_9BACT|nr:MULTISPECIES: nicotinamide riboside transporter PnuC [Duncaniella]MBJ2189460.1 nicotinamide mononucleotide transporter [Muribaculaceae bacterium]MCX4285298.1 nicotinamide riboside transporter PnuC [Duncaniella dubosii]QCD43471.1 nicotinamide riboside transporter PnuC [Duncaniella dubosii]HBN63656.1 nicotinamide riboside transporter PnuC [Porphyromonadaceae bacterium]
MTFDLVLEILGFTIGLLYLWWEYHADAKVWIASVVMPAISMWIYYSKGLYADFGINIYYLLIAVYGFVSWTRGSSKSKNGSLRITHIGWLTGVAAVCATLLLWWFIWWILVTFTDSTVPVADAFTTSLSIVGLWMLARKYVEQWLAWFVVDIVCCALYYYKGINFYCILYGIYTIVALLGFRKWLRMMKSQD